MTYDDVRDLALALPGVEESTSYGKPAFRVAKKWIAGEKEPGVLVVRVDLAEKEALLQSTPDIYFTTPHYDGYPAILVHLSAIEPAELRDLLAFSWRVNAPKKLLAQAG